MRYETINTEPEIKWVSPEEIKVMQLEADQTPTKFRYLYNRVSMHCPDKGRFNPYHWSGVILGGDWDKYVKPHKYDRVYKGLVEHMNHDVPLEETEYIFQYRLREKTYQEDGYTEEQVQITKELINSVKEKGVRTRYELGELGKNEPPYLQQNQWPITVNIGRDGEYIFNNTAHNRLALGKIFGLDKIPVLIVCRHKQYWESEEKY